MTPEGVRSFIMEHVYPIGAVYMHSYPETNLDQVPNINPADSDLLGFGVWEIIAEGQTLVGRDKADADFFFGEQTGGSKTTDHDHSVVVPRDGWGSFTSGGQLQEPTIDGRLVTGSGNTEGSENLESLAHAQFSNSTTADSETIDVVQPYFVVLVWKRVS